MAFLFRLLRSNAHATNYLLIGGAVTIPVLIFADRHQKSPDQIEAVLVRFPWTAARGADGGWRFWAGFTSCTLGLLARIAE